MKKAILAAFLLAGVIAAGITILNPGQLGAAPEVVATAAAQAGSAEVDAGKEVFEQCGVCHAADTNEKKMGPSLKGLFKKAKMQNGKQPTEANVRAIIKTGGNGMPEYSEILSDEEMNHLIAYLKTI